MNPQELADRIRQACDVEGFSRCGITPAVTSAGFDSLAQWIEAGYAGEMHYIADRLEAYRHPSGVLPGARSLIALTYPYPYVTPRESTSATTPIGQDDSGSAEPLRPAVARYTLGGSDYHDVIHPKLKRVCRQIRQWQPEARCRGVVDTAPLMEREIAQRAGLGWRGKNTLLLNKSDGSYFFLACLLIDVELPADAPHEHGHCGTCTACLDACPTDAFPQPGVLDATKCISYWTIESQELAPWSLRPSIGEWVFGCDVCQEVCPWNRKPVRTRQQRVCRSSDSTEMVAPTTQPLSKRVGHPEQSHDRDVKVEEQVNAPHADVPFEFRASHRVTIEEAIEWMQMGEDEFRVLFRSTPMWRARRRGWLRNVAIVLGNAGDDRAVDCLVAALRDSEPLVRASSVWALSQLLATDERRLQSLCGERRAVENDPVVLAEYARALDR